MKKILFILFLFFISSTYAQEMNLGWQSCYKSSTTYQYTNEDIANAMGLKVSTDPNPATNWVAFNYELPIDCEEAILIIRNTDGKQIDKIKLSDQIHQKVWNTSQLKPGTYIYELISKELKYTGKIVVIK